MGAASFIERRALQLHRSINADLQADPFDQDYCPAEVPATVVDLWHESQRPAKLPVVPAATDTGRQALAKIRALCPSKITSRDDCGRVALRNSVCWHDTPELYRKHLARLAGLPLDVAAKLDRDLTESEKSLLRAAARDFRDFTSAVASL
jgi:hypothetical protein